MGYRDMSYEVSLSYVRLKWVIGMWAIGLNWASRDTDYRA